MLKKTMSLQPEYEKIVSDFDSGKFYKEFNLEVATEFVHFLYDIMEKAHPEEIEVVPNIKVLIERDAEMGDGSAFTPVDSVGILGIGAGLMGKALLGDDSFYGKIVNYSLKSGVYTLSPLTKRCIICKCPMKIYRDSDGEIHRDNDPAVEWEGWDVYYHNGKLIDRSETLSVDNEPILSK